MPESTLPPLGANRAAPPLEEYVAAQLALTKRDIEARSHNRSEGEGNFTADAKGRMERSERYARWRYAGYVNGEIASL